MSISNRNFPIFLGSARSNDVSRVLAHPMVPGYSLTKPIKTMTIRVKIRHFRVKTNKKNTKHQGLIYRYDILHWFFIAIRSDFFTQFTSNPPAVLATWEAMNSSMASCHWSPGIWFGFMWEKHNLCSIHIWLFLWIVQIVSLECIFLRFFRNYKYY